MFSKKKIERLTGFMNICATGETVFVDIVSYNFEHIKSGVPHSSVLGPMMFLVYINDMHIATNSRIRLFAYDGVIYRAATDLNDRCGLENDL